MSGSSLILMLIALNPILFGLIVGYLTRKAKLPSVPVRVFGTLAYFVLTYGLLWVALSAGDFRPAAAQNGAAAGAPP